MHDKVYIQLSFSLMELTTDEVEKLSQKEKIEWREKIKKHISGGQSNDIIKFKNIFFHDNCILLDRSRRTIELFDPHGYGEFQQPYIRDLLEVYFKNSSLFKDFQFYYYGDYNHLGPQAMQKGRTDITERGYEGTCSAWSFLYMYLRITTPFVDKYLFDVSIASTLLPMMYKILTNIFQSAKIDIISYMAKDSATINVGSDDKWITSAYPY
jgi:hypothetical protein